MGLQRSDADRARVDRAALLAAPLGGHRLAVDDVAALADPQMGTLNIRGLADVGEDGLKPSSGDALARHRRSPGTHREHRHQRQSETEER
jgi:hypothetical protein